jgi:hypothetical protein
MSYVCQNCEKPRPHYEEPTMRVLQRRKQEYFDECGVLQGVGHEIVQEIKVGPCCKDLIQDIPKPPKVRVKKNRKDEEEENEIDE